MDDEIPFEPTKPRGRPRIPMSKKKVPVSTTLDAATYQVIQDRGWALNELIMQGVRHREKCKARDQQLLEAIDTIKMQEQAIEKLNTKIQEANHEMS